MTTQALLAKKVREMAVRADAEAVRLARKADLAEELVGLQEEFGDVFAETVVAFIPTGRSIPRTGLTDAIRKCLKSADRPLRACEVAKSIKAHKLTQAANPQASVGGCLNSLLRGGEARRVGRGWVLTQKGG